MLKRKLERNRKGFSRYKTKKMPKNLLLKKLKMRNNSLLKKLKMRNNSLLKKLKLQNNLLLNKKRMLKSLLLFKLRKMSKERIFTIYLVSMKRVIFYLSLKQWIWMLSKKKMMLKGRRLVKFVKNMRKEWKKFFKKNNKIIIIL